MGANFQTMTLPGTTSRDEVTKTFTITFTLDTGAHLRAGRVGGLLRLTEFAIAIGPAMNTALQAAFGELFLA